MITILGTEAGIESIRDNYPVVADPATRDRIELVTYRNALRRGDWHAGAIIFGDLERLFISEIPEVSRLWQRFSEADMPVRLLNHPTRTLRRFALLRRLHAAGINDFNVWRADEMRGDIRFPELAAHIWFNETNTPWTATRGTPLLGFHGGRAFALLYNGILGDKHPDGGNVLTRAALTIIREKIKKKDPTFDGPITVYGEQSRMTAAKLEREAVTFKQTPYDIKARR